MPPYWPHKRPAGFAMVPPCASLLAPQAVSIRLRNCRVARFGQALKPSKPSQQLSKASGTTLRSSSRSVLLALPWCLPIGPKSCFYWASKLPRGTFWAGLKTLKSLAAAFEGLSTAQPSAAALPIGPKSCFYWASKLPRGTFWAGLKTFKTSQQLSKASAPHNPPQQLSKRAAGFSMVPPYWPLKLFLLGFETAAWHVLGRP